jgi:hypothetical protein
MCEVEDEGFNMNKTRRRSNSSSFSSGLKDFKTKFDFSEPEPVFEEHIHGPIVEQADMNIAHRVDTQSSVDSIEEDVRKLD